MLASLWGKFCDTAVFGKKKENGCMNARQGETVEIPKRKSIFDRSASTADFPRLKFGELQ